MKQKIVMQVGMPCDKCRSKAMKIAVVVPGVAKVEIAGADKNQLVVIGDGIDSVKLTCKLRKKLKHAIIVSVEEEKEKENEKEKPTEENPIIIPCSSSYVHYPVPHAVFYDPNPIGCFSIW